MIPKELFGAPAAALLLILSPPPSLASDESEAAAAVRSEELPDGQHDFDWEIGSWKTHVSRLKSPLSGSAEWVDYDGVTIVRKVGKANIAELSIEGPTGKIEGVALRLYNPDTRQWSINWASFAGGELTAPQYGAFQDDRGEFYGQDSVDGRIIIVRFVISGITKKSARFEQAFSADGGKTWETNWIATDTRR